MSRFAHVFRPIFGAVVVAVLCSSYLSADIMIGAPTNHVASIPITGCTGYTGTSTLTPDPITHLAAAAANGLLDKTFKADNAQYAGWTLNFAGAALAGTLNIATYSATDLGACTGGASLDATYAPGKGDPAVLTFLQVFVSGNSGTHVDPFPNDDTEPFYYTDAERTKFGLNFIDNPQIGPLPANYTNTTMFSNYLVTFNAGAKTVTAYDGFMWGYMVKTTAKTPEPSSLSFFVVALGGLALAMCRKRLRAAGN